MKETNIMSELVRNSSIADSRDQWNFSCSEWRIKFVWLSGFVLRGRRNSFVINCRRSAAGHVRDEWEIFRHFRMVPGLSAGGVSIKFGNYVAVRDAYAYTCVYVRSVEMNTKRYDTVVTESIFSFKENWPRVDKKKRV